MKIRILTLFLALTGLFLTMAQAQFTYTTNSGAITITGYTGSGGVVTIPASTNGYPVTVIGTNAFNDTTITSVTIPSSVTSISYAAFAYCYDLTSVTIPNSVTNLGYGVFYNCYNLTGVSIPNSVGNIDDFAFGDCTNLTNVTIPDSVMSLGEAAFEYCTSLTSVTLGNGVTRLGDYAFNSCPGLTGVTIPDSVTSIGIYAFAFNSLTNVTIPNSVTNLGDGAFDYCINLTNLTVASGNPNYSSLNGVLFDLQQTMLIQYPAGIPASSYAIPGSVTSLDDAAFDDCQSLASVTLPVSVTNIEDGAFGACYSLANITVASGNPDYSSVKGVLFDQQQTVLIQYPLGTSGSNYTIPNSVTNLGDYAFVDCGLTSITIPASVTSIGDETFEDSSLIRITFQGNAPSLGDDVFDDVPAGATIYYYYGTGGWGATYGGLPVVGLNTGTQATLINGANQTGIIYTNTIADVYTFNANAGDVINLRTGSTNFRNGMELYGPSGMLVDYIHLNGGDNGKDNTIEYTATNSGTFTVLVSSYDVGGTGTYVLRLAQTPELFVVPDGDEGGPLTNGANATGTITLGDLDLWTFTANKGDVINLRLGTTNFRGYLQLYGPTGVGVDYYYLNGGDNGKDNTIEYTATNSGTFMVLVSSYDVGGTGTYVLRLAQTPELFVVPDGDEGGPLTDTNNGTITLGDMDMWTLNAVRGDPINLELKTTGFRGYLQLYGPTGVGVDYYYLNGGDSGKDESIEYTATNSGTFTVLISS